MNLIQQDFGRSQCLWLPVQCECMKIVLKNLDLLCKVGGWQRGHVFGKHLQGVLQPTKRARGQHRLIFQLGQSRFQGDQAAGQVAAVHRRDVERAKRFQRARVVPVIKMAAITFQLFHRHQCVIGTPQEFSSGKVPEIVRSQIRQ